MSENLIPFPINPPPGVVKNDSPRVTEGRWSDMDKMRFVDGKPQTIGGYEAKTATAMSGPPRTLHAWRDNASNTAIAAGTYKKLYAIDAAYDVYDITPLRTSGTYANNPFATTNGSAVVTVTHTSHGATTGDTVTIAGSAAVGGITPSGAYILTVVNANSYTITHSSNATSTVAAGGGASVTYIYDVSIGGIRGSYGLGYGIAGYGGSTYGSARSSSGVFIEARVWSLGNYGQILLAGYNGGTIYSWDPSAGSAYTTRAAVISDAPDDVRAMFITPERFVIALCDELEIKWCVQGDYTTWTPTATNTAGVRGVTEGAKLIGGRSLGNLVSLIWTDAALYIHQYTGSTLIFDTRLVGKNCGLISPSAVAVVGSVAYWMGQDSFFMFSGSVQRITNQDDVRDYIFGALDTTAGYQCAAMYVAKFNEVWFFYVTTTETEAGHYAILNLNDFSWAVGTMTRVGGTHFAHGDTRPLWADDDGYVYQHEVGHDADGVAMAKTITLSPGAIERGKRNMDIMAIEPDFFEQSGNVTLTINTWDRIRDPDDVPMDTDVITVAPTDGLCDARVSGRYAGLTIESNTLGGTFRFGSPTAYIKSKGSRP